MPYYADISKTGPVRYRDVPDSIGVLEAPDPGAPGAGGKRRPLSKEPTR